MTDFKLMVLKLIVGRHFAAIPPRRAASHSDNGANRESNTRRV